MPVPTALPEPLVRWHRIVESGDPRDLGDLLAEAVVFRSPAVHAPVEGRAATTEYLRAAMAVLGPTLRYARQWYDATSAVLEFTTLLGDVEVHGVDMLTWDAEGRLVEFTVMVRPFKAINHLIGLMAAQLEAQAEDSAHS